MSEINREVGLYGQMDSLRVKNNSSSRRSAHLFLILVHFIDNIMSEPIITYSAMNIGKAIPYDRSEFYNEEIARCKLWKKPDRYIEVVHIFLFNEHGEIIIQKRSREKRHNPNLLDKSIGGHMQNGDTPNLTAMIETIQELHTPSIVLNSHSDFMRTYGVLKEYISTSALLEYIDSIDLISEKIIDDTIISIGNRVHTYFWIYSGRVKNIDKEAKWILFYSLDELEWELDKNPEIFTNDLRKAIWRYAESMRYFLSEIWI